MGLNDEEGRGKIVSDKIHTSCPTIGDHGYEAAHRNNRYLISTPFYKESTPGRLLIPLDLSLIRIEGDGKACVLRRKRTVTRLIATGREVGLTLLTAPERILPESFQGHHGVWLQDTPHEDYRMLIGYRPPDYEFPPWDPHRVTGIHFIRFSTPDQQKFTLSPGWYELEIHGAEGELRELEEVEE